MSFHANRTVWQRLVQKLAARSWLSALLAGGLHHLDRPLLRLSRGRWSLTGTLTGLNTVLLTTTGAKSGLQRQTPFVALEDGERMILIASSFGAKRHPDWYYNLRAQPQVQLLVDGKQRDLLAQEADAAQRQRYWQLALETYAGYSSYAQRAGQRVIPVMILE
jgi:deazaflavin-dependent oxidoreductase (nitroreductase family)